MAFDVKKLTLNAMQMDDYTKSWGGVDYNTFLFESWPTLIADYNVTATTDADSIRYLYPIAPDTKYVIDGLVEGAIVFYNADAGTASTLTSFTVSLKKTDDVPSNETTIGTVTSTVSDSIAAETYGTYPFYFSCDGSDTDKHVGADELMLVYVEISHSGGDLEMSHASDSSNQDLIITIPIA